MQEQQRAGGNNPLCRKKKERGEKKDDRSLPQKRLLKSGTHCNERETKGGNHLRPRNWKKRVPDPQATKERIQRGKKKSVFVNIKNTAASNSKRREKASEQSSV